MNESKVIGIRMELEDVHKLEKISAHKNMKLGTFLKIILRQYLEMVGNRVKL